MEVTDRVIDLALKKEIEVLLPSMSNPSATDATQKEEIEQAKFAEVWIKQELPNEGSGVYYGDHTHVKEENRVTIADDGPSRSVKDEEPLPAEDVPVDPGAHDIQQNPEKVALSDCSSNSNDQNLECFSGAYTSNEDSQSSHNFDYQNVSSDSSNNHAEGGNSQCSDSGETAVIGSTLKRNTTRQGGEKPHQCPYCGYRAVQSGVLKTHIMALHTGEKPLHCPYCGYNAVHAGNLKNHIMARHTGEKPHLCPHCDYRAVQGSNLKRHIMVHHTREKPHQCPHCGYKAVQSDDLKRHIMARHSGEKPYQCPHCGYKAVKSGNLKNHIMANHTGEKPHQCSQCDYKSVNSDHLKKHIMAHHTGEKPHQCPHCAYKAVQGSSLRRHIKSHHTGGKIMHQCPHCDYKVGHAGSLRKHVKTHFTGQTPHHFLVLTME